MISHSPLLREKSRLRGLTRGGTPVKQTIRVVSFLPHGRDAINQTGRRCIRREKRDSRKNYVSGLLKACANEFSRSASQSFAQHPAHLWYQGGLDNRWEFSRNRHSSKYRPADIGRVSRLMPDMHPDYTALHSNSTRWPLQLPLC
jgi:hypothetical protein